MIIPTQLHRNVLKASVIERGSKPFKFYPRNSVDAHIIYEVWFDDCYGLKGLSLTSSGRPVVVDIGANIGVFTAFVLNMHHDAIVYAFEPQLENATCFETHVGLNVDGVSLSKTAVYGVKKPTGLVNHIPGNLGAWSVTTDGETELPATQFNSFLGKLDHIDILKLDCEGAEEDILMNLSEDELWKIRYIVGEYHPGLIKRPLRELQRHLLKTHDGIWRETSSETGIFRLERYDRRGNPNRLRRVK